MGIVVHPGRLRQELARRGWSASDLAQAAGVSHPTVGAALAGRPIAARSVRQIADALAATPPLDIMDRLLLAADGDGDGIVL